MMAVRLGECLWQHDIILEGKASVDEKLGGDTTRPNFGRPDWRICKYSLLEGWNQFVKATGCDW